MVGLLVLRPGDSLELFECSKPDTPTHQFFTCLLSFASAPLILRLPYQFSGTPQLPCLLSFLQVTRPSHSAMGEKQTQAKDLSGALLRASGCTPRGSTRGSLLASSESKPNSASTVRKGAHEPIIEMIAWVCTT